MSSSDKWHSIKLSVCVPKEVADKIYLLVFKYMDSLSMSSIEVDSPKKYKRYKP